MTDEESGISRRLFLGGVIAAASGLLGYFTGEAEAQTVAGTVGTAANPYERAYVDRIVFHERTSDPSSPEDGTIWYNSSG